MVRAYCGDIVDWCVDGVAKVVCVGEVKDDEGGHRRDDICESDKHADWRQYVVSCAKRVYKKQRELGCEVKVERERY
jgi:hypothetical protein